MLNLSVIKKFYAVVLMCLVLINSAALAQEKKITLAESVFKTLEENPGVLIEKESVAESRGVVQTASGQFDWVFFSSLSAEENTLPISDKDQKAQQAQQNSANAQIDFLNSLAAPLKPFANINNPIIKETTDTRLVNSTGFTRQYRNGTTFTPSFTFMDYKNDITDREPVSRSDVNVKITVPLLRGHGMENTGANEMAAASNLKAAELLMGHNISQDVFQTVTAFWNCLAAQRSFELVQDSNNRADSLLNNVNTMVSAGLLEPAFLNQARAQLYNTRGDVSEGEVSYYETRQVLALSMGSDSGELAYPPFPEGDFPAVIDTDKTSSLVPEIFINRAKKQRLDYLAALTSIETEEILLKKALNGAKPKLDFTVKIGYAGISEEDGRWRYLDSLGERMTGVNGSAGLTLELPIVNNAANGQIAKQNASVRKARLSADAAFNSMTSDILRALESIKGLVHQYDLAAKSEEAYKNAVVFENRKYDAGESSLNALIDIEDKYIDARLSVIETIRKYSIAVARLKFLTGSLLEKTDSELVFNTEKMIDVLTP